LSLAPSPLPVVGQSPAGRSPLGALCLDAVSVLSAGLGLAAVVLLLLPMAWMAAPVAGLAAVVVAAVAHERHGSFTGHRRAEVVAATGGLLGAGAVAASLCVGLLIAGLTLIGP
jgi:hypothetical protein